MERSGTPESPVYGALRRKCAQIIRKIFVNVKLLYVPYKALVNIFKVL
jgi:hypothetical protein